MNSRILATVAGAAVVTGPVWYAVFFLLLFLGSSAWNSFHVKLLAFVLNAICLSLGLLLASIATMRVRRSPGFVPGLLLGVALGAIGSSILATLATLSI